MSVSEICEQLQPVKQVYTNIQCQFECLYEQDIHNNGLFSNYSQLHIDGAVSC